jgi:hypothetical protein
MAKLAPMLVVVAALFIGVAASAAAETPVPAAPPDTRAMALFNRLYQVSVRVSRAVQRTMLVEVPDADDSVEQAYADAAISAGDAIVAVAARANGPARLGAFNMLKLVKGPSSGVRIVDHTLLITIDPATGRRPSQAEIERALERRPLRF